MKLQTKRNVNELAKKLIKFGLFLVRFRAGLNRPLCALVAARGENSGRAGETGARRAGAGAIR